MVVKRHRRSKNIISVNKWIIYQKGSFWGEFHYSFISEISFIKMKTITSQTRTYSSISFEMVNQQKEGFKRRENDFRQFSKRQINEECFYEICLHSKTIKLYHTAHHTHLNHFRRHFDFKVVSHSPTKLFFQTLSTRKLFHFYFSYLIPWKFHQKNLNLFRIRWQWCWNQFFGKINLKPQNK